MKESDEDYNLGLLIPCSESSLPPFNVSLLLYVKGIALKHIYFCWRIEYLAVRLALLFGVIIYLVETLDLSDMQISTESWW